MKNLYIFTHNKRLLKKWTELFCETYLVKHFESIDTLSYDLSSSDTIIFHDDKPLEELQKNIDYLYKITEKKNILLLKSVPDLHEGEILLTHNIGGYGNVNMYEAVLMQAVEVISSGNVWLYPELMTHVITKLNQVHKSDDDHILDALTSREKEIALLIAKGYSNQNVANELKIAQTTVKVHVKSIFEKLQIKSRVALALLLNK